MDHFALIKQGLAHHEAFEYEKALPFFKRAWSKHPMCAASIYNYANTLHMLGKDGESKKLLKQLIATDDEALRSGCPDGRAAPRSFKLDAYFLLYHVTFNMSESFSEAFPYAVEHLQNRGRGVRSVWTRNQVIRQLLADDPDPTAEQVVALQRATRNGAKA